MELKPTELNHFWSKVTIYIEGTTKCSCVFLFVSFSEHFYLSIRDLIYLKNTQSIKNLNQMFTEVLIGEVWRIRAISRQLGLLAINKGHYSCLSVSYSSFRECINSIEILMIFWNLWKLRSQNKYFWDILKWQFWFACTSPESAPINI